jgi:hypothetical protein
MDKRQFIITVDISTIFFFQLRSVLRFQEGKSVSSSRHFTATRATCPTHFTATDFVKKVV